MQLHLLAFPFHETEERLQTHIYIPELFSYISSIPSGAIELTYSRGNQAIHKTRKLRTINRGGIIDNVPTTDTGPSPIPIPIPPYFPSLSPLLCIIIFRSAHTDSLIRVKMTYSVHEDPPRYSTIYHCTCVPEKRAEKNKDAEDIDKTQSRFATAQRAIKKGEKRKSHIAE
jgi:hypothetical protein